MLFLMYLMTVLCVFFFSCRRRHTRCALVTGVQTCALPIFLSIHNRTPYHLPDVDRPEGDLRKAYDEVLNNDRVVIWDHFGSNSVDAVLDKEIGRASCRERVCQYV